jgi:hypothetical protein
MSSPVMLRWAVRVGRPYDTTRALIKGWILPAVRAAGWLSSPGTTHHVTDRGSEAWLTVVTHVDDATDVQDELSELLGSSPVVETAQDALLAPGAEWYRAALQEVTHVGLDVLEARRAIPLSEYEAFEAPSEAALRLVPFLNEASDTYRRASSTYESTERFWLAFFRRAPTPDLPRTGRSLWNLAG